MFVKLDKSLSCEDLDKKFREFGDIKSTKISINADYTSRGYGFVCY